MSRKVKMENVVRIFQQTIFFLQAKKILKENNKEKEKERERERKREKVYA